jgi:squalene-hopene/tetraprenyl-beta-curcumene cyclase
MAYTGDERFGANIQGLVANLRRAQCGDGSWDGVLGRIQETSRALRGMTAAGAPNTDHAILAAANWLIVHQQPDGGWRELPGEDIAVRTSENESRSGDRDTTRIQSSSAAHTAFALVGLVAAGKANHPAARRGVQFLIETQQDLGQWDEPHFVFCDTATRRWCSNDLLSVAWPLLALSQWLVAATADRHGAAESIALRLVNVSADN